MIAFLKLFPAQSLRRRARTILRFEDLEGRALPDGGMGDPPQPPETTIVPPPANQAPQIVDFDCEEIGNGVFLVTGRVIDEHPAGMVVTLGGGTSASGTTITCASDGTFYTTIELRTDGTDSGWLTATTVDDHGLDSNEASYFVNPTPP